MKSNVPGLREYFFPEARFGGFSRADAMIEFYTRIASILRPSDTVLDYGAGRGAQIIEDAIPYRRALKTLRGRCAHIAGCDLDEAVLSNPYLDSADLLTDPAASLPYEDESFDLIYSNWVFEHIQDPATVAAELLRVLKPGGVICAITPNRRGYISIASRMVANRSHVSLLKRIQPDRKEADVFPTCYRLNTEKAIKRHFEPRASVVAYAVSGDPAYHFNKKWIYRSFKFMHSLTPDVCQPILLAFIEKNGAIQFDSASAGKTY